MIKARPFLHQFPLIAANLSALVEGKTHLDMDSMGCEPVPSNSGHQEAIRYHWNPWRGLGTNISPNRTQHFRVDGFPERPSPQTVGYEFVPGLRNEGRRVFECKGPTRRLKTSRGNSQFCW